MNCLKIEHVLLTKITSILIYSNMNLKDNNFIP